MTSGIIKSMFFFTSSIVLHSSCMMMAVPCIQRSITIVSQHSICSCSSLFSISNSPRLNYFTSISANCNYAFQTDIAVLLQLMIGICEQMMWAIRDWFLPRYFILICKSECCQLLGVVFMIHDFKQSLLDSLTFNFFHFTGLLYIYLCIPSSLSEN